MQLPSRNEIRVRNLFNVVDCKLHWQKNGDYLCVKVDRTPKGTQVRMDPACGSINLTQGQVPSWLKKSVITPSSEELSYLNIC